MALRLENTRLKFLEWRIAETQGGGESVSHMLGAWHVWLGRVAWCMRRVLADVVVGIFGSWLSACVG